jgi:sec-independent protein translocase protein TatB
MGIHPTIEVATLGMWDTMIVMIMALVVFGPRRLPKIGRQIGKLMYEFRKASNDFRFQMEEELRNAEEADRRQREEAERQRALAAAPPAPAQIEASAQSADASAGATDRPAEYTAGESDSPSSYDEAAYEHYQRGAAEFESEANPEPEGLRVKPPETGAPVPADRPASRASAPSEEPAASHNGEFLPSGDEAAISGHPEMNTDASAPQIPPAPEAAVEKEPAAHHG